MAASLLQNICVRTHLDIIGENPNWGSGVIVKKEEAYYVITAYHCIYGENGKYKKKVTEKNVIIETQKGVFDSEFHLIKVIEIFDCNKTKDWALLKIANPGIDVDFSKVKIGVPDKNHIAVELCGYEAVNKDELIPFEAKIRTFSKDQIKIKLIEDTFQQGSEDGSYIAKGLSGSGVGLEIGGILYLIGIALSVKGEIALHDNIKCCPVDCLKDFSKLSVTLTDSILKGEYTTNQLSIPTEQSKDKIQILHIFECEEDPLTIELHKALRNIYLEESDGNTIVVSYNEILKNGGDLSNVHIYDSVLFFSNNDFITTWYSINKDHRIKLRKHLNLTVIYCEGDLHSTLQVLKNDDITIIEKLILPNPIVTSIKDLKSTRLTTTQILKVFCKKGISYMNAKAGSENETLIKHEFRKHFKYLNYEFQRKEILKSSFSRTQNIKFNLCILEGTDQCAHELLIQRIFTLAAPPVIIEEARHYKYTIDKNKKKAITKENLWVGLLNYILPKSIDKETYKFSNLKNDCMKLYNQLCSKDIIYYISCTIEEKNLKKIISEFWIELKEIFDGLEPEKRLFIFAMNKRYKKDHYAWKEMKIDDTSPFNSNKLTPIIPLQSHQFMEWYTEREELNTQKRYLKLLANPEQVLSNSEDGTYMEEVIRNTCNHFNLPSDFANEIITINPRNNR